LATASEPVRKYFQTEVLVADLSMTGMESKPNQPS
jgi:hypothetical protein